MEGALEDGLLTLDEENALNRYMDHFGLVQNQMNQNGVLTQVIKAAFVRDITEGIVPERQNIYGRATSNLPHVGCSLLREGHPSGKNG